MPRFWSTPLKRTTILKAGIIGVTALLVTLCGVLALAFFSMKPPKEKRLVETFQSNRGAYEHIREMISADQQISAVYADFGVKTNGSQLERLPSEANLPVERYREYVALLHQVGSSAVFKMTDTNQPDMICIGAWGAGWAGNTRHIWTCWTSQTPTNLVSSLDEYYRNPNRSRDVYRQIDHDWYLRADW